MKNTSVKKRAISGLSKALVLVYHHRILLAISLILLLLFSYQYLISLSGGLEIGIIYLMGMALIPISWLFIRFGQKGVRLIRLLEYGEEGYADLKSMHPTGLKFGPFSLFDLNFEYQHNGKTYDMTIRTPRFSKFKKDKKYLTLFNRNNPENALIIKTIPALQRLNTEEFPPPR